MRALSVLAALTLGSVAAPASAAQVTYAFQLTPTSVYSDPRDGPLEGEYAAASTGTFSFDTTTNQLLSFNALTGRALDFDPSADFDFSPFASALALFNAAGPCDLACFIEAINTGSYTISFNQPIRSQLTFGAPLNGSIVGTGPSGAGRPFGQSGTLRVTGPIPEPGTWALMLLGFGAIGLSLRRRPHVLAVPA